MAGRYGVPPRVVPVVGGSGGSPPRRIVRRDEMEHDWEQTVITWNLLLEEGKLDNAVFKEYWKRVVSEVYKIEIEDNVPKMIRNSSPLNIKLLRPLEIFMFTRNPGPARKELQKIESSVSTCGRVFRLGESTYTCRDCAMDSTCVLCVDCFKQSVHKNHRYKMGSSVGGGCCDCGDKEAWKAEPWCNIHKGEESISVDQPEPEIEAEEEPLMEAEQPLFAILDTLDADLVNRVEIVFTAACRYAFDILTYYNYQLTPEGINPFSSIIPGLVDNDTAANAGDYCSILYNDESHTYDQVRSAVVKVISCSPKSAMDIVTQVDRDGRALLKAGDFQACLVVHQEVQSLMTRVDQPQLKTLILHQSVIAHQQFALDLLAWIEKMVKNNKALRLIFAKAALKKDMGISIVEGVMLRDSRMWKFARMQWNRLLFYGLLLEYSTKKCFAKVLTECYSIILKEFMNDDHDHSFSVASLSVQVYTVPSLALDLIKNNDVLYTILNTFYSECMRMRSNDNLKILSLSRNQNVQYFKRSHYVLYDLRYLLSFKPAPNAWSVPLRRSFLHGYSMFLNVLALMQGMEPFSRCLYEHAEYEQEWESSFYLHCKMACVISLMQEWCGEDDLVLIKAYKTTLKRIKDNPLPGMDGPIKKVVVANHTAECLEYDVSKKAVSIHIPLTRLFAALYLHLQKFDLNFYSEKVHCDTPTIEQVMEPALRQQALIAQVHANMWRRNGMNVRYQLQWYANCKCRNEMLNRDIVMLQTAASVMDPNEFLINVLNRFNLVSWAQENYSHNLQGPDDDSLRQVITLAEEFLGLLLTIVGERFVPGVGQVTADECLCNEILQQLCIKSMSHSELNQSLYKDFNHETGLENVVHRVADLKDQPQGKKLFELKPGYNKEFNVFFYHFTREDRSRAEENQRKQRKSAKELECCPPPLPPPFTPAYANVANLFTCDVTLSIIANVINRTINLKNSCFSELQLQETLFLMGYALLEELRQLRDAKSTNTSDVQFKFSLKAEELKIIDSLEDLLKCPRIEARGQIPLITWVLCKYRLVVRLRDLSSEQIMEDSEHLNAGTSHDEEAAKKAKESRSECVAKHRARTLLHMQSMQANFMKENASLLAVVEAEMKAEETLCPETTEKGAQIGPLVAVGVHRSPPAPIETRVTCILCQATEIIGVRGAHPMVMAALVQQSTVLCRKRERNNRQPSYPVDVDEDEIPIPCAAHKSLCLSPNLSPAPHINSCGHTMHNECFTRYYQNAVAKETRRTFMRRLTPAFDIEKQEFVCPLCNNLSNCILPVIQPAEQIIPSILERQEHVGISLSEFVDNLSKMTFLHNVSPNSKNYAIVPYQYQCSLGYQASSMRVMLEQLPPIARDKMSKIFTNDEIKPTVLLSESWTNIEKFCSIVNMVATGQKKSQRSTVRLGYLYQSCAYTIHSMEWIQREPNKPLFGQFTSRQEEMLRVLMLTASLHAHQIESVILRDAAVGLIHSVLHVNAKPQTPCILEWDPFSLIVTLTLSMSYMCDQPNAIFIPTCGIKEAYMLQVVLILHIVSLMLGLRLDTLEVPMETENCDENHITNVGVEAYDLLKHVRSRANLSPPPDGLTPNSLWQMLTEDCIPFLRCCAIFFRYMSGVPPPEALKQAGGDTFEELCTYLGLPSTCEGLLGHPATFTLASRWCEHKRLPLCMSSDLFVPGPIKVNELIKLPKDFMDLINSVSMFSCPMTRDESRNPTMCLVCGQTVCLQSYCCQVKLQNVTMGPCMYHAYKCGAGIGLFLRIRECEALVLSSPHRGCFATPPYVDEYGETDEGLRRGNPLHLCTQSYKDLQNQWLSHSLPQVIGRNYDELNHRLLVYQWPTL